MVFWSLNVKAVWPIYCLKKWSSTTLFSSGMQLQKLSLMCTRLIIKRNFHAHSHPLIMQYMNEVWHNLKFHLHIIKDHTTLYNYVSSKLVLRITILILHHKIYICWYKWWCTICIGREYMKKDIDLIVIWLNAHI